MQVPVQVYMQYNSDMVVTILCVSWNLWQKLRDIVVCVCESFT